MNLSDYASSLICSKSLENKLFSPEIIEFNTYQSTSYALPSRPTDMAIRSGQSSFPNKNAIRHDLEARGIAFLFFANHELLAIELYAWALLRFPNISKAMKRCWTQIIKDEQKHLRLYINRALELGAELNSIHYNDFFWKCIVKCQTPEEFISAMSLTVEQANLDFSYYFKIFFKEIGDDSSADIMQIVYEDEIRHVQHGVEHLKRNSQNEDHWETHFKNLRWPLSPKNCRGKLFDRKVRTELGFEQDYIDRLERYHEPHGHHVKSWCFNPYLNDHDFTEFERKFAFDYGEICGFLAESGDIVLSSKKTEPIWEKHFYKKMNKKIHFLSEKNHYKLKQLPYVKEVLKRSSLTLWNETASWLPSLKNIPFGTTPSKHKKEINSKQHSKKYRDFFMQKKHKDIFIFHDFEETHLKSDSDTNQQFTGDWIFKPDHGSSGTHNLILKHANESDPDLKNFTSKHKTVVAQRFQERIHDFGLQFKMIENQWELQGITHYICDQSGKIQCYLLGLTMKDFWEKFLKSSYTYTVWEFFLQNIKDSIQLFTEQNNISVPALGIDFFITKVNQQNLISSPLEVNFRYTLGHIALEIQKHFIKKDKGIWMFEKKANLKPPFNLNSQNTLWTTDPVSSKYFASFCLKNKSFKMCLNNAANITKNQEKLTHINTHLQKT